MPGWTAHYDKKCNVTVLQIYEITSLNRKGEKVLT